MHSFEVIKATGEREKFDIAKLRRSLQNAGAEPPTVRSVIKHLEEHGFLQDGVTTKKIYHEAYRLIKKQSKRVAGHYKLKESLLELGPSGYPFEVLMSEIFRALGYQTEVGKIVEGKCISHEIDVIAKDEHEVIMMECKFHNRQKHHSNVIIPLYVQSRFQDVSEGWQRANPSASRRYQGYAVTNTRFTQEAIDYARCVGLKLLSWNFPEGQGLKKLIEQTNIHPITSLSSLTKKDKRLLLKHKIVHCRQLLSRQKALHELEFNHVKISNIMNEAEGLCKD